MAQLFTQLVSGETFDTKNVGTGKTLPLNGVTLTGSAGNDVLVGGSGSDRLVGSAGHDILISGELDNAFGYDDLRTTSDNWASNWEDYLDSTVNPEITSDDVVDESVDQLTGSSGHDWFIVGTGDKITDINSATKDGDKTTYL